MTTHSTHGNTANSNGSSVARKSRLHAALAVASVALGLATSAMAVHVQADSTSFTSPIVTTSEFSAFAPLPVSSISPHEQSVVRLDPIEISAKVASKARRAAAHADADETATTCVPYWRKLEQGPFGKQVLVTCPGATFEPSKP